MRRLALSLAGCALLVACGGGGPDGGTTSPRQAPVASVTLQPSDTTVDAFTSFSIVPTLKDASGTLVNGRSIAWTSSSPTVATVEATGGAGKLSALAPGTTTITATSEGVAGTAHVVVRAAMTALQLKPNQASLRVGQTVQLTATPMDGAGNPLTDRPVAWSTNNAAVATVNATGLVTAVAPGSARITATAGTLSVSADVTVAANVASVSILPATARVVIGALVQLAATPRDANGNALTDRPVTWSSSDSTTVRVSSTGTLTGLRPGTAAVTATSEGKSGSAAVTVVSPVVSITIAPAASSLLLGQTTRLTATENDSAGQHPSFPVVWSTSAAAVATVDSLGLVSARSPGTATITATSMFTSGSASVTSVGLVFASISARTNATCGLTTSGAGYCWGSNAADELGTGSSSPSNTSFPQPVSGGLTFRTLDIGSQQACGTVAGGAAYCWGFRQFGALGDGISSLSSYATSPVRVQNPVPFDTISAGQEGSCALGNTVVAYCWGWGAFGKLGDGDTASRATPVPVAGGHAFAEIASGAFHVCGRTTGGQLFCWGRKYMVGNDSVLSSSNENVMVPVQVSTSLTMSAVSAGDVSACALAAATGDVYCWSAWGNSFGWLGTGDTTAHATPTRVVAPVFFKAVAVGGYHACALAQDGGAWCWGDNRYGQLGTGSFTAARNCGTSTVPIPCSLSPVQVAGGLRFVAIRAGSFDTCALTAQGTAYCWGFNGVGQLGDGTSTNRAAPTKVLGQP